jgi:DNA helicase-2/ATP-dependent DNA helicase PcrA
MYSMKVTRNSLKLFFLDSPRLLVEAPAGYGKTTTMISRIAYLFASGHIPNPKRILGLTFSVNAALKV